MDRVDYIIDTSQSQEEALDQIMRMARQEHGDKIVDSQIDAAATPEDAHERIVTLARRTRANKEDGNLDELYKGLKHTTVLAKPLTFLTTPITEAVRAPFKWAAENIGENTSQTPPIDTGAEYDSIYPSDRAGAGLLVRDMANAFGIQGQPVAKITSEDYPKAAEFAQQMTDPINVAGAAVDIGAPFMAPKIPIVSGVASTIDDTKSFANRAKPFLQSKEPTYSTSPELKQMIMTNHHPTINLDTALAYIESVTKDKKLLAELKKSGKIIDVAKRIVAEPEKYLQRMKPERIFDEVQGSLDKTTGKRGTGELDRLFGYQKEFLENAPQSYQVPADDFQLAALDELNQIPGMDADQANSARGIVQRNTEFLQPDPNKVDKINTARAARKDYNKTSREQRVLGQDLEQELIVQKKNLMHELEQTPDLINNPKFRDDLERLVNLEPMMIPNTDKDILRRQVVDRITELNQEIYNIKSNPTKSGDADILRLQAEKDRLAKVYNENFDPTMPNKETYYKFLDAQNLKKVGYATEKRMLGNKLMSPPIPGEVSTDIAAKNMAGRALERAGSAVEDLNMAMLPDSGAAGVYKAQNKHISDIINLRDLTSGNLVAPNEKVYIPSGPQGSTGAVAAASRAMDRFIRPTASEVNAGLANTSNVYGELSGQLPAGASMAANEFIYSKSPVNSYKIPRNTQEAAAQADMVKLKLEREFGKEISQAFEQAQSVEEVQNLFANLSRMNPNAFAASKYMAIDGKISDPIMKQMALEDIVKSKGSAYENAKRAENLINHNYIGE